MKSKNISKSKKSQGLSLTTIIVAALAIIVLVVLVGIFTGRIGGFGSGAKETQEKALDMVCRREGRTCVQSTRCIQRYGTDESNFIDCSKPNVCCSKEIGQSGDLLQEVG